MSDAAYLYWNDESGAVERSEIEAKYLWATETIFPNKEAWEKTLETGKAH